MRARPRAPATKAEGDCRAMYVEQGEVYVRRVRAVSGGGDPLALRTRLAGALAQASLHPKSLPRSAVLVVRSLRAPRASAHGLARQGGHAQRAWAEACAESIERLLASAARPARGFVPAAAESVVFADRAELLACLAGDWCAGQAQARWWWRALFERTGAADALVAEWRAQPEYVPGALAHLARQNLARDFALALPADSARLILDGVAGRFALTELTAALAYARRDPAPSGRTHDDDATGGGVTRAATVRVAPWRRVVPEAAGASLNREAACLLGVGLMLQRAPSAARSSSFARAVREWLRERDAPPRARVESRADPSGRTRSSDAEPGAVPRAARPQRAEEGSEAEARAPAPEAELTDARDEGEAVLRDEAAPLTESRPRHAPSVEAVAAEVPREADTQTEPAAREARSPAQEPQPARAVREDEDERRSHVDTTAEGEVVAAPPEEFTTEAEWEASPVEAADECPLEAQIVTRFGGVFFLVNLGLFLELYGDFSAPLEPGLALPAWDFCALLGQRMCGRALREDPVWALLARLAGRGEKTEPGAGFEPPGDWRVARSWLKGLPRAGAWRWTSARGRLRVVHPSGFAVLDVARDGRAAASQLADELEAYRDFITGPPERAGRRRRPRARTPLARWLDCLSAYVRVRLSCALGCEARSLPSLLFELTARVSVTTTHVDVCMPLSDLHVVVRVAGLDRDPGWVPAAGRHIAFHFD